VSEAGGLPPVRTRALGDFRIHALEAGTQRLDGGAMFGVVPKPLWERRIPADERNRIPLGLPTGSRRRCASPASPRRTCRWW
jgi:hypothetical protein